jgi:hypothetical protein
LLLALPLKSGVINASDDLLESASAIFEWVSLFFGVVVFVGVSIEVWLAWSRFSDTGTIGHWGPVFADFLVAAGVGGEIWFAFRASRCQGELSRRSKKELGEAKDRLADIEVRNAFLEESAAMAMERAATLEKEAAIARERVAQIEKITAWRRVSPEQHGQIVAAIRESVALFDLLIEFQANDPEAYLFAREIANIFVAAGVGKIRLSGDSYLSGDVFGIRIATAPGTDSTVVSSAFAYAGIPLTLFEIDLSTHLSRAQVAPNLYIFVAPKPPLPHVAMAKGTAAGTSNVAAVSVATRESNI